MRDVWGNIVDLSLERELHIAEHPEMAGYTGKIAEALESPDTVVRSRSDASVCLFHRAYTHPRIGRKYLCVVVKYGRKQGFVITAYFTDKVKSGEAIWPE